MSRSRLIATLGFTLALAAFAWQGIAALPAELERLRSQACLPLEPNGQWKDRAAPDFTLKDHAGRDVALAAQRGKVVFLNFWATWCPPCVDEMASLERLATRFRDRSDFVLLAVSEDKGWQEVREFFRRGTPLTVLMDESWRVAHAWGTEKLPETYVLDKRGNVRLYVVNKRDWGSPQAATCVESLLDEAP